MKKKVLNKSDPANIRLNVGNRKLYPGDFRLYYEYSNVQASRTYYAYRDNIF